MSYRWSVRVAINFWGLNCLICPDSREFEGGHAPQYLTMGFWGFGFLGFLWRRKKGLIYVELNLNILNQAFYIYCFFVSALTQTLSKPEARDLTAVFALTVEFESLLRHHHHPWQQRHECFHRRLCSVERWFLRHCWGVLFRWLRGWRGCLGWCAWGLLVLRVCVPKALKGCLVWAFFVSDVSFCSICSVKKKWD